MSYLESQSIDDPVRPGEQWFCYWKTSASLWENRILQFLPHEVIFIPIFWGFHSQGTEGWDFGQIQPEKDLLRLTQLISQHGRKFCWLLPLTPAPFLPNGGVPVASARTLSLSRVGVHITVFERAEQLNKIYSFFEPKVFQSFVEFLGAFGTFLGTNKIKAPLWGTKYSYKEQNYLCSYLDDHSIAFEQGFSRYLKKNTHPEIIDPALERSLKLKFTAEVQELFKSTAETALSPFWMGVQEITVIGGSPSETIERSLTGGKSRLDYVRDLFDHYSHDRWVSTALLSKEEKGEVVEKIITEHFGTDATNRRYHYQAPTRDLSSDDWSPFNLIDVFDESEASFRRNGLLNYLDKNLRWMYTIQKELRFTTEWIEENSEKIKFFHGATLDRTRFGQMLKLFMMGEKIVLDTSGLSSELSKRLEIFYIENSLRQQTVNFATTVSLTELGEGRFITFDGARLDRTNSDQFWNHLFRYLNLNHVDINLAEDVFGLWRIRATTPHELNFLDVRRVNLYNPTSYKKQVTVQTRGGFAFIKMIDPSKATAKSVTHGVEVELLPQGRIALDFGHFEET